MPRVVRRSLPFQFVLPYLKRWTMIARQEFVADKLRIAVDEVKARLQSGEPITILDVRNDKAWEATRARSPEPSASGAPPTGTLTRPGRKASLRSFTEPDPTSRTAPVWHNSYVNGAFERRMPFGAASKPNKRPAVRSNRNSAS